MRKITSFLLLIFVVLISSIDPVQAYTIRSYEEKVLNNFALTPGKHDFLIESGTEKTRYITIVNRSGETHNFSIKVQDFRGTRDPDDPLKFFDDVESDWSAKDWLTPELDRFTLRHGERIKFGVKVQAPEDASVGGHYAGVFVSTYAPSKKNKSKLSVPTASMLGSLFLLRIPGKIVEKGRLKGFKTTKSIYFEGPINSDIVFQNDGNIHLKPQGQMVIRNQLGMTVEKLKVEPWIVLAESVRKTTSTWNEKPFLRIGKYSAEVNLAYGDKKKQFATAKTTFLVIPRNLIILASFLILALSIGLYYREAALTSINKLFRRQSSG